MRWSFAALLLLAFFLPSSSAFSLPQGGGHTLFGDFTVDEGKVKDPASITFYIILYTLGGRTIGRETITSNGRYRFLNLANGDYILAVEFDNSEVARIPIRIEAPGRTDMRQDVALEWRAGARGPVKIGTVSAAEVYTRTPANKTRFEKALEAIRKKDDKTAFSLLKEIVAGDVKDFVAWTELGTLYFKQDETDEAEKAYQRAIEAQPTFMLALLNLGKIRLAQKNFEGAIEVLSRAVAQQPQSADANFFLGECYLQIKKGSKAVGYLYEAIRLDPVGHAQAHLRLAALYKGAGLKDRAVAEYEQFLAKKPDYPDRKKIEQFISENKKQ